MIKPDEFRFFLDSGAYTAWTKGAVIDLDLYCAFIRSNIERIEVYACLDVIPGRPGVPASEEDRCSAAEQTWDNFLYMKRDGLDPLPVFHYAEPWRYLDRMIDYGCDYVGIGGLVSVPGPLRRSWLDSLFTRLCDAQGLPSIKTHGFGMTAVPLIFRYPWHSVDSSAWLQEAAGGKILLPAMRHGEFVFDESPTSIAVSESKHSALEDGRHGDTLAPKFREVLDRWLKHCGTTYEACRAGYSARALVNVTFYRTVSETKAVRPFQYRPRQGGLL